MQEPLYVNLDDYLEWDNFVINRDELCLNDTGISLLACTYRINYDLVVKYCGLHSVMAAVLPNKVALWLAEHCDLSYVIDYVNEHYDIPCTV